MSGTACSDQQSPIKPVRLEVIAPTLEGLGLCTSCELILAEAGVGERPHERALDEYPQEWQDECRQLADWVYELAARYSGRVLIKVIDPRSPEGLVKSLRYGVRRYPTFIVAGQKKVVGWDRERLEATLALAVGDG